MTTKDRVSVCVGVYPGYGVLPPELARDAAAAAAAASMSHLAGLGSLSPGGLAYARAAMVCLCLKYAPSLLVAVAVNTNSTNFMQCHSICSW